MSLKAGRVGVNPADVDPISGHINSSGTDAYTKAQADDKFLSKSDAASTYESKSDASTAHNLLQPKTLAVPIEMLLGTKLTVESALQGLNEEINDINTVKEGTITTTFTFGNTHTVRKYGKVVELNLIVTAIEDVTAYNTAIAQISAGFRPNADIQPISFLKVGSEKVVRGYIKKSTGEIQLQENVASGANGEFRIFATWITS